MILFRMIPTQRFRAIPEPLRFSPLNHTSDFLPKKAWLYAFARTSSS